MSTKALVEQGPTDKELAEVFGIVESTLYRWQEKHREFRESIKKAKEIPDKEVEAALYKRCIGYTYDSDEVTAGLFYHQQIIWVKEHPVLTRTDFMGNHEWCFYGWKKGAAHKFYGPHNVQDVWSIKKITQSKMEHLTEKPLELAMNAIKYSSKPGENVLDLFGGAGFTLLATERINQEIVENSGSTLIAAEQMNRRAFLMEIDPLYCDIIVARWELFSGKKGKRDGQDK